MGPEWWARRPAADGVSLASRVHSISRGAELSARGVHRPQARSPGGWWWKEARVPAVTLTPHSYLQPLWGEKNVSEDGRGGARCLWRGKVSGATGWGAWIPSRYLVQVQGNLASVLRVHGCGKVRCFGRRQRRRVEVSQWSPILN